MLIFLLAAATPSVATGKALPEPSAQGGEQRICKHMTKTGTLVRRKKVCGTQKDWDALEDASIEYTREMQTATRRKI